MAKGHRRATSVRGHGSPLREWADGVRAIVRGELEMVSLGLREGELACLVEGPDAAGVVLEEV